MSNSGPMYSARYSSLVFILVFFPFLVSDLSQDLLQLLMEKVTSGTRWGVKMLSIIEKRMVTPTFWYQFGSKSENMPVNRGNEEFQSLTVLM